MEKKNILDIAPEETLQELNVISDELLKKAGLIEMNEKLKTFLITRNMMSKVNDLEILKLSSLLELMIDA